MKSALPISCLLFVLAGGCAGLNRDADRKAYEQQFQTEWIHSHIVIGQTTREQILAWYGRPMNKTSMMQGGAGAALMPDEIWTYSLAVSESVGKWYNPGLVDHRSYGLAISFKNGVVSNVADSSQ
jgi:hypothetical protein